MSSDKGKPDGKRRSNFRPPQRKVTAASDVLARTFKALHLEKKAEEYAGFPYWPEVIGEEHLPYAKPEKILSGRVLVVRVVDAVWAQELSLRKQELLDNLHAVGAGAALEDIRFVTGNPKSFS